LAGFYEALNVNVAILNLMRHSTESKWSCFRSAGRVVFFLCSAAPSYEHVYSSKKQKDALILRRIWRKVFPTEVNLNQKIAVKLRAFDRLNH